LYFHPDTSGEIPRPTNGAFITRLADAVRARFPEKTD